MLFLGALLKNIPTTLSENSDSVVYCLNFQTVDKKSAYFTLFWKKQFLVALRAMREKIHS